MSKVMRSAFLWNVGGYAIQMLSLLAQVVIVSRILNSTEVGVFGVSRGILAIVKAIPNSGAIYALASLPRLRPIHFRMMSGLMSMAGLAQAAVVIIGCGVSWMVQGPTPVAVALATLSLTCLFEGQQLTSESLLMRRLNYQPIVAADGLSFVASIGTVLAFRHTIPGFHLLTLAAYFEAIVRLIALKYPTWHETKMWWPRMRVLKGTLIHTGKLMSSNLLNIIASNGDRAIVAFALGEGSAGFYWRGQQLINAPITAYGRVVNKVLMPAAAHQKTAGVTLEWVVDLALNTSIRMGLFAGVGLWVLGEPVIEIVLGRKWLETATVLQITGLLIVFRFMFKALDSIVVGQLLARVSLVGKGIQAVTTIAALFVGAPFGLAGACWAVSAAQFITAAYYIWAMVKNGLTSYAQVIKVAGAAFAEAAVLSVPIFTAWWLLENSTASVWVKMGALGVLMAAWGVLVFMRVKKARRKPKNAQNGAADKASEKEPEVIEHLDS